jgi:hypothetical protein
MFSAILSFAIKSYFNFTQQPVLTLKTTIVVLKHLILVTLIFPFSLGFATFTIRENLFPTILFVNFLVFNKLCSGLCDFHIIYLSMRIIYILTRFNPF